MASAKGFCVVACCLALLVAASFPVSLSAVELGKAAPELDVAEWAKGDPVSLAAGKGKNVFVVEFWATWCPPCRESAPHLTELQKKYADKGVVIAGISNETVEEVKAFLDEMKEKMDYHVGVDTKGTTWNTYMENVEGIPHAYVIDQEGLIVWQGHPMSGLDQAIEQALAGKVEVEHPKKIAEFEGELQNALRNRDTGEALQILEQLLTLDPANPDRHRMKVAILGYEGKSADVIEARKKMAEVFADDPNVLNEVAWDLITDSKLDQRDPEAALALAIKAVSLSEKNAPFLDTLAMVHCQLGLIDKAISLEEKALSLAVEEEEKADCQSTLDYFKKVKTTAEKVN